MIAWPVRRSISSLDSTFSRRNRAGAKLGRSRAKRRLPVVRGSRLDANSKVVRDGQMKVLQPLIDRGDIRVLADIWVPEWSPTEAYLMVKKEWTSSTLLPPQLLPRMTGLRAAQSKRSRQGLVWQSAALGTGRRPRSHRANLRCSQLDDLFTSRSAKRRGPPLKPR